MSFLEFITRNQILRSNSLSKETLNFVRRINDITEKYVYARFNNKSYKHPRIRNKHKVSVTRIKVFTDSYQERIIPQFERLCRIKVSTFLDVVLNYGGKKNIKMFDENIRTNSSGIIPILRKNNLKEVICVCCKLKAKYVYLERDLRNYNCDLFFPQFYGVKDGKEILMTVDHIIPKVNDGKNCCDNLQILCRSCNTLKSSISNEVFIKHHKIIDKIVHGKQERKRVYAD